jgi:predicted PurR-regulated permease PerM
VNPGEERTKPSPAVEAATAAGLEPSPAESAESRGAAPGNVEELARSERHALGWAAGAAVAVVCWIVMPVGVGLLLGTLLAFVLQPVYERLTPPLGRRGAALTAVGVMALGLSATMSALVWLLGAQGAGLARQLINALGPGGGANRVVAIVGHLTARFGITPDRLQGRLQGAAEEAAARGAGLAEALVAASASALLALFFAILTMHFILRNWQRMSIRAQEALPLRPDYTRKLFDEFRRVGRTTLLGTVVTGLAQGTFATVGYAISGVPKPLFFGAATAAASLIPAVGTMLVWVPVGIVLIVTGHPLAGGFELAWGTAFIVAISDYVIRPHLVGGDAETPAVATFAALFGGVEVFGLKGLIIGPVLMALAIAVLKLYVGEAATRRRSMATLASDESAPADSKPRGLKG